MAFKGQWSRVQGSDISRQLAEVYGDFFPIEARHYFCDWIEDQPWDRVNPEAAGDATLAESLFTAFLSLVADRIRQCDENGEFMMRLQFDKIHTSMMMRYSERPLEFVRAVQHGLNRELSLLRACESSSPSAVMNPRHSAIEQTLHQASTLVEQVTMDVRTLQEKQEGIVTRTQDLWKIRMSMKNMKDALRAQGPPGCQMVPAQADLTAVKQLHEATEHQLCNDANLQLASRSMVYQKTGNILRLCAAVLSSIIEELTEWRFLQYKARGGGPPPGPLDGTQKWCEALADILWTCRRQVQQLQHQKSQVPVVPEEDPELGELDETCRQLLYQLITKSFIVERQPQQVVKTQTRFGAAVRMLAGCKLSLHLTHIEVQAHIIPTQQARTMLNEPNFAQLPSNRSDIKNPIKVMEYNRSSEVFGADFTSMILPRRPPMRRAGGHADLSVAEEKFCMVFTAKCSLGNGDIEIPIMAISCPLVVIVHATQSVAAEATMFWDSAFSDPRTFAHREAIEWREMETAVNLYYAKNCERAVDDNQLRCLYSKAFPMQEYNELTVFHINKLHRETMEGRRFTFWSWIYSAADLIKKHALNVWAKGLIEGFLSREQAEEKLRTLQAQDTFLIRFSESTEGALTVAYSEFDKSEGGRVLDHLVPWTAHDLAVLTLANRIRDFDFLKVLYPNTPKNSSFSSFYTATNSSIEESLYTMTVLDVKRVGRRENGSTSNSIAGALESNPPTPGEPVPSPTTALSLSLQAPSPMTVQAPGSAASQPMAMSVAGLFDDPALGGMLPQLSHQVMASLQQPAGNPLAMPPLPFDQFGPGGIDELVDSWANRT